MEYYTQTPEEALSRLDTDRSAGLSSAKVKEHAEKYGRNEFTRAKRKSLLRRIWEALTEPMLILLLCAWAITIAVNVVNAVQEGIAAFDWAECAGILVAVLISVVLTVVMEGRSAKAFDELNKIKEGVEIKVVRDGIVQYVPQQELVVGDIVYLETGNKVAADGRLIESTSLMCDESSLTGESAPVEKNAGAVLAEGTPVAERVNGILKSEWIDDESFENFRQAQGRIDEIIHIYNSLRPHASCDWLTPMEAERRTGKLERHWCRKSVLQKTSVNSYQDNIF